MKVYTKEIWLLFVLKKTLNLCITNKNKTEIQKKKKKNETEFLLILFARIHRQVGKYTTSAAGTSKYTPLFIWANFLQVPFLSESF